MDLIRENIISNARMPDYGPQQVYVVQHELGPVKIGRANNPRQRMKDLQVSCPFKLKLRKTKTPHNAKEVEAFLHRWFEKYHMRGEWFDLPPDQRDFEIPTYIKDSGKPDVEVGASNDPDMDSEWAELLDRVFKAMKTTKYQTEAINRLRGEWQEMGDFPDKSETGSSENKDTPDLHDIEQDTPVGKVRCSQCGHHFDRNNNGCPTCGSGSYTDGSMRY